MNYKSFTTTESTHVQRVDTRPWIGRVDQAWGGRGKEGGVVSSVVVVLPCIYAGKLACMQTQCVHNIVVYRACLRACAQQKLHMHALDLG